MEKKLREYAKLLVEVGLNVQSGQTLVLSSPVECAYFARLCASAAYDAGCREVVMNWGDDYLAREKYLRADSSVFDTVPAWREAFFNGYPPKAQPTSPSPPVIPRLSPVWIPTGFCAPSSPAPRRSILSTAPR